MYSILRLSLHVVCGNSMQWEYLFYAELIHYDFYIWALSFLYSMNMLSAQIICVICTRNVPDNVGPLGEVCRCLISGWVGIFLSLQMLLRGNNPAGYWHASATTQEFYLRIIPPLCDWDFGGTQVLLLGSCRTFCVTIVCECTLIFLLLVSVIWRQMIPIHPAGAFCFRSRILEEFAKVNEGNKVEVVYAVCGWSKSEPRTYNVQLVPKVKLQGTLVHSTLAYSTCFPTISCQLWALSSSLFPAYIVVLVKL